MIGKTSSGEARLAAHATARSYALSRDGQFGQTALRTSVHNDKLDIERSFYENEHLGKKFRVGI